MSRFLRDFYGEPVSAGQLWTPRAALSEKFCEK